ncbi:MAG: methylenetetrahydrofolate reductase [NAD(P)H] [Phycisphaerales bacterium]|nr:methylenetetrahydrofolate reductase [NAD(P)H] [Phycisphaerales bacterium]
MHLGDALSARARSARQGPAISFEFFPPKTEAGWAPLFRTIAEFEALAPAFVSVTYGAGGTTRDKTHALVLRIRRETSIEPVPHLTCIGHTKDDVRRILELYAMNGVETILALRGDPPVGAKFHSLGDFERAEDLVRFIRVEGARLGVHGGRGFAIGVAGFPEGHPETPNTLHQLEHLKAKVDAGADYIVTQLFFDNNAFHDWRERCTLAHIRVPIVAGIMPVPSISGMQRMADLAAGTRFPAALLRQLEHAGNDKVAVEEVGIAWAEQQCRDLVAHDVEGIHFYTLNKSDVTKRVCQALELPRANSSANIKV